MKVATFTFIISVLIFVSGCLYEPLPPDVYKPTINAAQSLSPSPISTPVTTATPKPEPTLAPTPEIKPSPSPLPTKSVADLLANVRSATVRIITPDGSGTGFIIDRGLVLSNNSVGGLVLTNNHVVGEYNTVVVTIMDAVDVQGTVMGRHYDKDIALIKLTSAPKLAVAPLGDSDGVSPGSDVFAVGYAFSSLLGEQATVSKGIVSAIRDYSHTKYLQIDAAINPGNSGGPLININGEVIGINTARLETSSGRRAEGISLALAINQVKPFIADLSLGISFGTVPTIKPTVTRKPAISPTPNPGYDRGNPAGTNDPVEVKVNSSGLVASGNDFYNISITLLEVIRGEEAWQRLLEKSQRNPRPEPSYEYILAKVGVSYLDYRSYYEGYSIPRYDRPPFDISPKMFEAISMSGKIYGPCLAVGPDPSISARVFFLDFHVGWIPFTVEKTDSKPIMSFGDNYRGGGIWFKLWK